MDPFISLLEAEKLADLLILAKRSFEKRYQIDKVSMVILNGPLYESKRMNQVALTPITRKDLFFQ